MGQKRAAHTSLGPGWAFGSRARVALVAAEVPLLGFGMRWAMVHGSPVLLMTLRENQRAKKAPPGRLLAQRGHLSRVRSALHEPTLLPSFIRTVAHHNVKRMLFRILKNVGSLLGFGKTLR